MFIEVSPTLSELLRMCNDFVRRGSTVIPLTPEQMDTLEVGLDQLIVRHTRYACPSCGQGLMIRPNSRPEHFGVECSICGCEFKVRQCPNGDAAVALVAAFEKDIHPACSVCGEVYV